MAGLVQWALERNVTITVTGLTVPSDFDGEFTEDSITLGTISFNGRIRQHSAAVQVGTHNRGVIGAHADNRPVEDEYSFEVEELASALPFVASGTQGFGYGNILRKLATNFRYAKLVITLNDNTASPVTRQTVTAYVLITGLSEQGTKPEVVDTMSFVRVEPVNIGAAMQSGNLLANTVSNPAYS